MFWSYLFCFTIIHVLYILIPHVFDWTVGTVTPDYLKLELFLPYCFWVYCWFSNFFVKKTGSSCLKNCYMGKLLMLKILHGSMLLHSGLGFQLLERILLLKVLLSSLWSLFRICLPFCFLSNDQVQLDICVLLILNLQEMLQIKYLLLMMFTRAKLHCLWLLFSQLSPNRMYEWFILLLLQLFKCILFCGVE